MIPNVEVLLGGYVRSNLGARVVSLTPTDRDTPWVRYSLLDITDGGEADHLVNALVQFDCLAGKANGRGEAWDLGVRVRDLLKRVQHESFTGAVFTGASVSGPSLIPDDDFEPARQRAVISAQVWLHP